MTLTVRLCSGRSRGERWSFTALVLAAIGLALSAWVILASDGDSSHVRWWLVVAPLVLTALPLVGPRRDVRVAVAFALGAWCFVAALSIGMFLLPALAASAVAAREDE